MSDMHADHLQCLQSTGLRGLSAFGFTIEVIEKPLVCLRGDLDNHVDLLDTEREVSSCS
jgi:hypothetical protein